MPGVATDPHFIATSGSASARLDVFCHGPDGDPIVVPTGEL